MHFKTHIIGSNGFVGRNLVKKFEKTSTEVFSINRTNCVLVSSSSINYLKENISNGDEIIFISAIAPCRNLEDFSLNITMMKNFIEGVKEIELSSILYLSSDAVYAKSITKIDEGSEVAISNYHSGMHLMREFMVHKEIKSKRKIVVRPTSIFGVDDPHKSYGPNQFLDSVKSGNEIQIHGLGEEIREHIHINDVCELLYLINLKGDSGIYNLSSGIPISFNEVAQKIIHRFPNISIKYGKRLSEIDDPIRIYSVEKIRELHPLLNFESLDSYLDRIKDEVPKC